MSTTLLLFALAAAIGVVMWGLGLFSRERRGSGVRLVIIFIAFGLVGVVEELFRPALGDLGFLLAAVGILVTFAWFGVVAEKRLAGTVEPKANESL